MDISVRDWMIIIGVLLIVAVLLDGYRRMRDPNRIRMSLTQVPEGGEDDATMSRELPNGGARVKSRVTADGDRDGDDEISDGGYSSASFGTDSGTSPGTEVPRYTPPSAPGDPATDHPVGEPPLLTERPDDSAAEMAAEASVSAASEDSAKDTAADEDADDPLFAKTPVMRAQRGENLDLLAGISVDEGQRGRASAHADAPQEVLMLHVVSRSEAGFAGDDILQVLLAYNLRFGDMDFFHRHDEAAGRGTVQFSVANMLQPGVFDIDRMGDFSTTGLIFFLSLPGPGDMMGAFELMLETARGVAEHLGGDVLDESRSVATRQTLEHMRQRIRELERKLLAQAGR
ncbi:MAG: cell division protein ZipA [Pseudomonadota bacterium]